ncbi:MULTISPECIES: hypothetical protein [Flavobacterium]|jgi:hypothetical protein|uniref:Uncharacterized protein n=1 Tax=Flavobacterium algoritolerans TaxID=3041254 RepID=A0ABT6V7M0_9FLAO|nr:MULTISPECIES: hypothetical protein [Flavobacterium]MDI5889066.1 hypothetical protein [Flavobacterium yafengii]MDI5894212.1 hypothetical protein [Flavobacterium algoritolerans]
MKKYLLLFLLMLGTITFAQNTKTENVQSLKITQKKCLKKKGFNLVLKELVSDSRCPEGVTCIWAGEASVVVSVYKDSKLVEDHTMVFSMKNEEKNKQWFSKYLPEKQKNIKNFSVFPYPKEGVQVNPKNYYVKIGYVK